MYYFSVTFNDGQFRYNSDLTKRQAVIRYNRWLKELGYTVRKVEWGLM